MDLATTLILVAVGVVFSAFFSGAETALTAFPVSRIDAVAKGSTALTAAAWRRWRTRPHRVLVTLLAANTAANIGISAIATDFATRVAGDRGVGYAIGVTTLLVLVFGEVTPKTFARVAAESTARRIIVPIAVLDWLLTPLVVPLLGLSHLIARVRRVSLARQPSASRLEDIRFLLSLSRQEGHLSELQHDMLEAVLRFEHAVVREVQVPRTDVTLLADTLSFDEVRRFVIVQGFSRYPVYHDRDDNVVGILHAKDLLRAGSESKPWTSFLQPPLFVPESKSVVDLLREMRDARTHVALSIDEYGNIAGLVTLEDIIETIVGDIEDEFDAVQPDWLREAENTWLVSASMPIDRLARLTGRPLELDSGYTSLAGLLLQLAGRVPAPGTRLSAGGLTFEVTEATARRIVRVRVSADVPAPPPA